MDLSGHTTAVLSFSHRWEVETIDPGFDVMMVEASEDGGVTWNALYVQDSVVPAQYMWAPIGLDMTSFAGSPSMVRFCFDTRDPYFNDYDGWFIDSVAILVDARAAPNPILFRETFDGPIAPGAIGISSLWHVSDTCSLVPAPTPTKHLGYYKDETCTYNTGSTNSGSATLTLSLQGLSKADLSFHHKWDNEGWFGSYDRMYVEASRDNGASWTPEFYWDSTQGANPVWIRWVIPLDAYVGNVIQIRWHFDTVDPYYNDLEGWFIDDVTVTGTP